MNEAMHHRGPDAGGLHVEPGVGLAHRRLSIIDLATGQQPLYNEDGTVVVVFNGEIYNYRSLIAELTELGHVFRTKSDTEVIVHAWEAWGEACVRRFRGMFAFALWDRNRETLFLARDRLGVKPLHYAELGDGLLVFGSEEGGAQVELGERLAESVRLRMIAEVALGAFLSGGVDSSAMVAVIARVSRSTPARLPSATRRSTSPGSLKRSRGAIAPGISSSRWKATRLQRVRCLPHRSVGGPATGRMGNGHRMSRPNGE
jgi:asparagine synthetase B (glutamine-hydrolysing)